LQTSYDKDFGGHIKPEKSLGDKIRELEFHLNKWVDQVLVGEVGTDYIKKLQRHEELFEKEKTTGLPYWRHLNFQETLNSLVLRNDFWGNNFKDKFVRKGGYAKQEDLKYEFGKLWEYRSNHPIIGHFKGPGQEKIFSDTDRSIVKAYYDKFVFVMEACGYYFDEDNEEDEE